jgi:subtilisin family serine protease
MLTPSTRSRLSLRSLLFPAVLAVASVLSAQTAPPAKKPVLKADDLPRHTYKVSKAPSAILTDDAAFAELAGAVRSDMDTDLKGYDIQDPTTLKGYKITQLSFALLDKDYSTVSRLVGELRALEDKPSLKLTTALVSEALVSARKAAPASADFGAAFQAALTASVQRLPWEVVENDIKSLKAGYEIRTPALLIGSIQQSVDPAALKTGEISATVGRQLVNTRNQMVNYLPYKANIVAALEGYVALHSVVKPDLWSPRLVTLPKDAKATTVRIGIWDSGVDVDVYKDSVITDASGRHGIAFDLHDNPSPDLLFPVGKAVQGNIDASLARLKGFIDLQAAVDSPESSDLKRYMGTLKAEEVKPLLERLSATADWVHGSHVAGIALDGDPFARLVIARLEFDYHVIPETPTIEQARKDCAMDLAAVAYFKENGARVVNMSWGGDLKDIEDALEQNGAGGTAEERKKLARQICDISVDGLRTALKSAPGILFVVAAGNSDNNVDFDEVFPSSLQLPNMITVGAVDQAGEETSFSSFGPMVNIHANGYEVESSIPGGKRMKLSGTSMAAPEITNLAGKLFALDAALTPEEAKALILAGCDKNGRVNLASPVKSVALLKQKMANP